MPDSFNCNYTSEKKFWKSLTFHPWGSLSKCFEHVDELSVVTGAGRKPVAVPQAGPGKNEIMPGTLATYRPDLKGVLATNSNIPYF